ncbi:MAG: (d)CMP kinase [Ruminococcaceae bacterium]|jgi:cytidylate kinase|nr:(d)CMP kinase [Oscillospiraceae bacterium]
MTDLKHINIAIDGPSGAGKSTLARRTAQELGYIYVDTGAMYRAIGLYVLRRGIAADDKAAVVACLPEITVDIGYQDGVQRIFLNGEDVSGSIRTEEVSQYASAVSAVPEVRAHLMGLQRSLAARSSVIMDGRDIGTVILPDADIKIYLTASEEDRAMRRFLELREKGQEVDYDSVLENIRQRDWNDMHRDVAPLRQAEDAIVVDTSGIGLEESARLLRDTIEGMMPYVV